MRFSALMVLVATIVGVVPACAGQLSGFTDSLSMNGAGGWACATNSSADVNIAAYAGPNLIGIYPLTVSRPELAGYCRDQLPHGFSIDFDPGAQALFAGQKFISLFEVAPAKPTRLLPPSGRATRNPLPLPAVAPSAGVPGAVSTVPIAATVTQKGGNSGILNNLFTAWAPPLSGFAGLSGTISYQGNDFSFSEALVQVGTTMDDQAACEQANGMAIPKAPVMSHIWAGILKSNGLARVGVPVNFTLPHPLALRRTGACLAIWVSAGYAFLSGAHPRYTTTSFALQISLAAMTGHEQTVTPMGMGGEFGLSGALPRPAGRYVGIRATQPIAIDGLAAAQSAAPVVGAPASFALPSPVGDWVASTSFMVLPKAVCTAAQLGSLPPNGPYALLRDTGPETITIPAGAIPLLRLPMPSRGTQAIQRSIFAGGVHPGFGGVLGTGDCLIAYTTGLVEPAGVLDVENQTTVFLRPLPFSAEPSTGSN